jgi:hypothetical protein
LSSASSSRTTNDDYDDDDNDDTKGYGVATVMMATMNNGSDNSSKVWAFRHVLSAY